MRIAVLATALSSAVVGLALADPAAAAIKTQTNIAPQELSNALRALAAERHLQILYTTETVASRHTAGAVGEFTVDEALTRLLGGTGLVFQYIDENTITILSRDDGASTSVSPKERGTEREGSASSRERIEMEEIVVTGTYIRGTPPVGAALKVYTREDIDRSGAATIDQFARHMTENFSNTDLISNLDSSAGKFGGVGGSQNVYGGASFNLRGIGPSATLTLINGNRIAAAGHSGAITDISQIPLSAVDHVEVLADGASALYGADAVAGVVNMIMRDDFDGAESSIRYGGATDGGATQLTASQLLGASWGSGNAMMSYQYTDHDGLSASERSYIPDLGGEHSLMPGSRGHSVFLSSSQSIDSATKLSESAMWGERDTDAQRYFRSDLVTSESVDAHRVSNAGVSLALEHRFSDDWLVKLSGNYSRVKQDSAGRSMSSLSGESAFEFAADSSLLGADLLVSGSLLDLPGGALKAALGAGYREDTFENVSRTIFPGLVFLIPMPKLSRNARSVFGELRVPILAGDSAAGRLEVSAAGRYDDYNDFGSTTNYKVGLGWSPIEQFQLRATYGTSYRAPLLADLGSAISYAAVPASDGAGGFANVIFVGGGNPNLEPEEAQSFTAGLDFSPLSIPRLSIAVTYFDIDFSDRISAPSFDGNFFTDAAAAPFVTFNPALADVEAIFAAPGFTNYTGQGPAAIAAIYDPRVTNLASTRQSGVDVSTTYEIDSEYGQFNVMWSAEYLARNETQAIPAQPFVEYVNRFAQPPKRKMRAGVAWAQNQLSTSLFVNYVNSYRNGLGASESSPGSTQTIDAWTTADINVSYATTNLTGVLQDLTISLSVSNVTDEKPPLVVIPIALTQPGERPLPFDAANASPLGRFVSLQVSKRW